MSNSRTSSTLTRTSLRTLPRSTIASSTSNWDSTTISIANSTSSWTSFESQPKTSAPQSNSTSTPWNCSTKIWLKLSMASNQSPTLSDPTNMSCNSTLSWKSFCKHIRSTCRLLGATARSSCLTESKPWRYSSWTRFPKSKSSWWKTGTDTKT